MELQDKLAALRGDQIRPYAISYDSVETLKDFADRHNITYPLLSDTESRVIEAFGILNTLVPRDHRWFGVPFPGTYMVDEKGVVFDRSFYADHGVRDSVARMLARSFAIQDGRGTVQVVETTAVKASAWLSADTVRRGQVHTLTVDLEIKPGFHVYGRPIPSGYIPTTLRVDPLDEVQPGQAIYAAPQTKSVLGEKVSVYSGSVSVTMPVQSRRRDTFVLDVHLDYQACDDSECLLPDTISFSLPLRYLENP